MEAKHVFDSVIFQKRDDVDGVMDFCIIHHQCHFSVQKTLKPVGEVSQEFDEVAQLKAPSLIEIVFTPDVDIHTRAETFCPLLAGTRTIGV